jgi:AraC family transcriptional regulator of arabinose operon
MVNMVENLNDSATDTYIPPPGILIAGHFNKPYGYHVIRQEGTKDWLIVYTLSGAGQFVVGNEIIKCREGDVMILSPGTTHNYATQEGYSWEFMWSHFIPSVHWSQFVSWPANHKGIYHINMYQNTLIRERVEQAFQRLLQYHLEMQKYHEDLSLNSLEEIFILLAQAKKTNNKLLDPRVELILQILTGQMSNNHSIDLLAQSVSLSPSRLAHLFKEQVGESIITTLNQIRLRQASKMLEFTNQPIAEIAYNVGFNDSFYFTAQFTKFFGMNPSAYRKMKVLITSQIPNTSSTVKKGSS